MARVERDECSGREQHYPETLVERIAWGLCAHASKSRQGYLQDDELEGIEALLRALERRCGNERAEADFLGVPLPTVRRYLPAIKRLAKDERMRREEPMPPITVMHLTASYWQDYLPEAQVAFSVAIEDARTVKAADPPLPAADRLT